MEAKKNPSRDVHRLYPLTLVTGLCASIFIVIMFFELHFKIRPVATREPWEEHIAMIDPDIIVDRPPEAKKRRAASRRPLAVIPSIVEVTAEAATEDPVVAPEDPFEPEPASATVETIPGPEPEEEAVAYADVMPIPDGGYEGFYKLLRKEMRYPRKAAAAEVSGRVFVEFVVDREGNTTALRVVKGIGSGCDEEAVRVLSKTKWTAGRKGGRTVKVRMILPVYFSLNQ
jgi:protein TonB